MYATSVHVQMTIKNFKIIIIIICRHKRRVYIFAFFVWYVSTVYQTIPERMVFTLFVHRIEWIKHCTSKNATYIPTYICNPSRHNVYRVRNGCYSWKNKKNYISNPNFFELSIFVLTIYLSMTCGIYAENVSINHTFTYCTLLNGKIFQIKSLKKNFSSRQYLKKKRENQECKLATN